MAQGETGLRGLLELDRQIVLDILDTAYKLIVDVGAHYYWTHHALEICGKLVNIGHNLSKLLDMSGTHWSEGKHAFAYEEPLKLWNTSIGLFRALGPEKAKFVEQLAKRRRQRISGQNIEETDMTDPDVVAADKERFKESYAMLIAQYAALSERIKEVPSGLIPPGEDELPALNGKREDLAPGAVVTQPAPSAQAAPPPPDLGGAGEP
jgi:hypothetical protein